MEFILIRGVELEFKIRNNYGNSKRDCKVDSITRVRTSSFPVTLNPVIDRSWNTIGCTEKGIQSLREISGKLLVGDTELANQLKRESAVCLTAHLTLTSSNTGKLKIESKLGAQGQEGNVFDGLHQLQEGLPPNSTEFILSFRNVRIKRLTGKEGKLNFKEKGLKIIKNRRGTFSLEMEDLQIPEAVWWTKWRQGGASFVGRLQLNLKLDSAAVIELYKRRFGKGSLAAEVDTPADTVILVGGNEDKEQGIKCHKSVLSEMSPVFEAMFQADMIEKKEGTLRIVEFSEACVRALIEFCYRRNLEEALESSEMAVEMLQAAHMYQIKELMNLLLQIILSMPFSWFSVDGAIKLFFFTRMAGEDLADANKKSGKALKWFAEKYPQKLIDSKEYENLCGNPGMIMQLGLEALKNPSNCVIN